LSYVLTFCPFMPDSSLAYITCCSNVFFPNRQ